MANDATETTIKALDALLEQEREALLEGDLERLTEQFDRKKALINALDDAPQAAGASLHALQGKVLRNQALLDSALGGIRSVANMMNALQRIHRTLETYDQSGRRMTIESACEKTLEKRA